MAECFLMALVRRTRKQSTHPCGVGENALGHPSFLAVNISGTQMKQTLHNQNSFAVFIVLEVLEVQFSMSQKVKQWLDPKNHK